MDNLVTNQEIWLAIENLNADKEIVDICPQYGEYLKMEEDLKELDNKISACNNILEKNMLNEQRDIFETKIWDFIHAL